MTFISRNLKYIAVLCVALAIGLTAANTLAQEKAGRNTSKSFCSNNNNWSSDDRVSVSDLREVSIPSSGTVGVDAGKNGGVSVKGEDRGDVLVLACVQAWGSSEEAAKAAASGIRIDTRGTIKAEGSGEDKNWSVSYQILVPRSTNLNLKAHNGGISISGVDGSSEFETINGGLNISNVSGSVKGRTTNGGVNVALSGNSWRGSGLDLTTTNGGVNITLPENYAATVETGTVNGGFKSDIPSLNVTTEDIKGDWSARSRSKRITTALNGGGPMIRVITTNGGVKINSADRSAY
ncbi:hypothetical protein BH20ACI2_BH20ACI2_16490 [soil metagenome]